MVFLVGILRVCSLVGSLPLLGGTTKVASFSVLLIVGVLLGLSYTFCCFQHSYDVVS